MEEDKDYLTQFLNRKIEMSAKYILRMPPVFMMRQEILQKDSEKWNKIKNIAYGFCLNEDFSYLDKPLYNMQPSTIRPKKDADDESIDSDAGYDYNDSFRASSDEEYNQEEVTEEDCNQQQNEETDQGLVSFDTTTPSRLIKRVKENINTTTKDCFWVPNYLLRKSVEFASRHEEIVKGATPPELVSVIEGEAQRWFMTVLNECGYQAKRKDSDSKIMNAIYSVPSIAGLHSPIVQI